MTLHRSLGNRAAQALAALPAPLVERLAGPPMAVDGRVLDRRVQLLARVAERLESGDGEETAQARRARLRLVTRLGMPTRTDVHVHDRRIDGPGGELPVRVYRSWATTEAAPAIVFLHGGGWVTGDLDTHDGSCRLLAAETGCIVIAVHYRRAPEHPFPAAVDDALAAYRWVHDRADELWVQPGRVAVMGDSAGGNLAAVLAWQGRDLDVPPPVAQGLVYPALDATFSQPSQTTFAEGPFLTLAEMHWFRAQYLPHEADWTVPLASPLLADDVAGVAPALVVTAGFDPLRDDGRAYAERLAKAGVEVRHRCYDSQVHGFFGMGVLPGGMAVATEVCRAMGDLVHRVA